MLTGGSKGLFKQVLLRHLPEAATGVEVVERNIVRGESGCFTYNYRSSNRSRAPDLDVHPALIPPGPIPRPLAKPPRGTPSTRSPRRCWRSVECRARRDLGHVISARTHTSHPGPVATLVRRVGVRELRLHRTV